MDNIFKEGDKVFHVLNGWGTVGSRKTENSIQVTFKDNKFVNTYMTLSCNLGLLSFTEYSLEKGGFSQDRDLALIGKWCQVWDNGEKAKVRIAKVQAILQELDYPYQAEGVGWANAEPLDEETISFLIQKGILPHGNDTRDNSNS